MHVYYIIGMHVYNIKANVILWCEQLASQLARAHLAGTKGEVHGVVYRHIDRSMYDVVDVCVMCVIQWCPHARHACMM